METKNIQMRIEKEISDHPVLLFMKGTKLSPLCGFSAKVVEVLNACRVQYHTINVLEDADIREGIKEFSNWPTIPQLYIKGEFIGGCDIVTELFRQSELQKLLP